jgi:amidase
LIQRLGYKYLSLVAPLFDNSAFIRGMTKGLTNDATMYIQALNRRDEISAQLEIFLRDWDGWICPVTPGVAFTHRQVNNLFGVPIEVDKHKLSYWTWSISYTAPFSLTGNPVVTLPIAQNQEGLPIGVQLVGKRWQDYQLLAVAQKVFDVVGGFKRPVGY